MLHDLEMDYFRNTDGPVNMYITGENAEDFRDWLTNRLRNLDISTEVNFVEDDEWKYKVTTERTREECISLSITYDSVWWQRGYWFTFEDKSWSRSEFERLWHQIGTLREYGGEVLGLSDCADDDEREELYSTMIKLSDFVAKEIAKKLHEMEASPTVDNIVTLGSRIDWNMLNPIDKEESEDWESSRDILKLYAGKSKRFYEEMVTQEE